MKAALAVAVIALLTWLGWRVARPGNEAPASATVPETARIDDPPGIVIRDGADVFRKAFWKHPAAADRILHAERREWSDGEKVERWQWFLVVKPSPELVKHLREDNAFSLSPASLAAKSTDPPAWFSYKPGEVETLQSPGGEMQLFFGKANKILYATASGGGFAHAVETCPLPRPRARHPARPETGNFGHSSIATRASTPPAASRSAPAGSQDRLRLDFDDRAAQCR